jgi:hypothetical protein
MLKLYGNNEQIIINLAQQLILERKGKMVNSTVKAHFNNKKNQDNKQQKQNTSNFESFLQMKFEKRK